MSILGAHSSRHSASFADEFDHEIVLQDATKPRLQLDTTAPTHQDELATSTSGHLSASPTNDHLSRKWTLREEIARRRYAKFQESRYARGTSPNASDGVHESDGDERPKVAEPPSPVGGSLKDLRVSEDTSGRPGRVSSEHPNQSRSLQPKLVPSEMDILYENQRGWFFCGIPLFSHKSLLNFDPAPWSTEALKDSSVDITNAQLPDPSWRWVWKSWYVDMSPDVDDEGWQYSFSFSPAFSWHGTHVWFHSFVRRRRWLRKRVKQTRSRSHETAASDAQALGGHMLNQDYFTIHPSKVRSRESSVATGAWSKPANKRFSALDDQDQERGEDVEDLRDVGSLTRALKLARIDREKVDVVTTFLERGGDDIYYLAEKMPNIMSSLVFQASRRQLLAHLLKVYNDVSAHRDEHVDRGEAESDEEKRKLDNLLQAVKTADVQVRRLEYWSDVKEMARKGESKGAADEAQGWGHGWQGIDDSGPKDVTSTGAIDLSGKEKTNGTKKPAVEENGLGLDKGKAVER